jgi:hypothetical protein
MLAERNPAGQARRHMSATSSNHGMLLQSTPISNAIQLHVLALKY